MTDLIREPLFDKIGREYLLAGLAEQGVTGVKVGTVLPPGFTGPKFIRCWVTPGRALSLVARQCLVTAQVYGTDEMWVVETAGLCGDVLAAAERMTMPVDYVTRSERNAGPYRYPDPTVENMPRYQVVVNWTVCAQVT